MLQNEVIQVLGTSRSLLDEMYTSATITVAYVCPERERYKAICWSGEFCEVKLDNTPIVSE